VSERRHPSNSAAQQRIERAMVGRVAECGWLPVAWTDVADELGLAPVWQKAKPDCAWRLPTGGFAIAECFARSVALKPGQWRKIATDALKLLSIRSGLDDPRKLLCLLVVPKEIEDEVRHNGWLSVALQQAAEIVAVELEPHERAELAEAVARQSIGQARKRA